MSHGALGVDDGMVFGTIVLIKHRINHFLPEQAIGNLKIGGVALLNDLAALEPLGKVVGGDLGEVVRAL